MKRLLAFSISLLMVLMMIPLSVSADNVTSQTVVFLKDAGADTNDGTSADKAVQTWDKAYDLLDLTKDCTIVVCGPTKLGAFRSGYYDNANKVFILEPGTEYTGSVTITSVYDGVDYATTAGAKIVTEDGVTSFYGTTVIDKISIEHTGKAFKIFVQCHEFTIGKDVKMTFTNAQLTGESFTSAVAILGGFQSNFNPEGHDHTRDTHINLLSGERYFVVAFNRVYNNTKYGNSHCDGSTTGTLFNPLIHTGDTYINIEGDTKVNTLVYANERGNNVQAGDVVITVKDNAEIGSLCGQGTTGWTAVSVSSLTVNWQGGVIKSADARGVVVTGDTVLNCAEGIDEAAIKTIKENMNSPFYVDPEGDTNDDEDQETTSDKKDTTTDKKDTDTTKLEETTDEVKGGGCGSVVGGSALIVAGAASLAGVAVTRKKKENN